MTASISPAARPSVSASSRAHETLAYFEAKADRYDETDNQPYWAFSDRLLWQLLEDLAFAPLGRTSAFSFLDAGAGTARWSLRLLQHFRSCTGTLVDVSPDMLRVATRKLEQYGCINRATIRRADLQAVDAADLGEHDLVISFHNVLSFVSDPERVIAKLLFATKTGGTLVLVVPNLFHAAYFSVAQRRWAELDRIEHRMAVRFNDQVPEMALFTSGQVESLLQGAGAATAISYGFPVTTYPGIEETFLQGSSNRSLDVFADSERVERLFALERSLSARPEAASRGNNLLIIARR